VEVACFAKQFAAVMHHGLDVAKAHLRGAFHSYGKGFVFAPDKLHIDADLDAHASHSFCQVTRRFSL
jgi:hypothetical protein